MSNTINPKPNRVRLRSVQKPYPPKLRWLLYLHGVRVTFVAFLKALVTRPPRVYDDFEEIRPGEPWYIEAHWEAGFHESPCRFSIKNE